MMQPPSSADEDATATTRKNPLQEEDQEDGRSSIRRWRPKQHQTVRFFWSRERVIITLILLHSLSSWCHISAYNGATSLKLDVPIRSSGGWQHLPRQYGPQLQSYRYHKLSACSLTARLEGELYSPKNVTTAAFAGATSVSCVSPSSLVTSTMEDFTVGLRHWNRTISQQLYRNEYSVSSFQAVTEFFQWFEQQVVVQQRKFTPHQGEVLLRWSSQVDQMLHLWTTAAFTTWSGSRNDCGAVRPDQVWWGYEIMQHQWAYRHIFVAPYNAIPKRTLLQALRALTAVSNTISPTEEARYQTILGYEPSGVASSRSSAEDAAFRILQRLLTNVGVRIRSHHPPTIHEYDFNAVLNAYVSVGKMDQAQRVVTLQERTSHAPPISAVTCSILLKGYGKLQQLDPIQRVVEMMQTRNIQPDTILMNSLLDAYINCNALDEARNLMTAMENQRSLLDGAPVATFASLPRPNGRTYNIFLKGLANAGLLDEAIQTAQHMDTLGLWDAITTNTLVHAAIVARKWIKAEQLLADYTTTTPSMSSTRTFQHQHRTTDHPNVEAYTELIDAYAKQSNLRSSLSLFQTMRERGVPPNEITYTCMIAGFGRNRQLDQARKMMAHMSTVGIPPTCVTYNSLLSAWIPIPDSSPTKLLRESRESDQQQVVGDADVDEALRLLRDMIQSGIRPNAVTAATLVLALGHCAIPRVQEAKALVQTLEHDRWIPMGHTKVMTALMQTCGMGRDMMGAVEAFRAIQPMDTVAVNVFLEVCCRCGRDRMAFDTFEYYFRRNGAQQPKSRRLQADLVSYSILMASLLRRPNTPNSFRRVESLYKDMKSRDSIHPDRALVDIILKAVVRLGQTRTLTKDETSFVVGVLRDAQRLQWEDGQLERRKRAIQAVVGNKWRDVWLADQPNDTDNDLFKRKGWNPVDSSFRLWGYRSESFAEPPSKKVVDRFLESKGWNDVDSGFRII